MKRLYRATSLVKLRRRLLRRRAELSLRFAHDLAERKAEAEHHFVDTIDQAASAEQDDVLAQIARTGTEEVTMIDEAIARMERGTYGTCQACGGGIGLDRLMVVPCTRFCSSCQLEQEQHEPPMRHVRSRIRRLHAAEDDSENDEMPTCQIEWPLTPAPQDFSWTDAAASDEQKET